MILSHKHRYVFVKGMKVAGTSVEMALSTLCGPDDIVTPIAPVDEQVRFGLGGRSQNYSGNRAQEEAYLKKIAAADRERLTQMKRPNEAFYNHMPLSEVITRCGRPIGDYRVVGVERSPYSKILSWMNMRISFDKYRRGEAMIAEMGEITSRIGNAIETGAVLAVRNIDRYRQPNGGVSVHIIRYSSLEQDFADFVGSLGIPEPPILPHAKKGLMADAFHPRDVFTRRQIDRINTLFEEEFKTFGYDMITGE